MLPLFSFFKVVNIYFSLHKIYMGFPGTSAGKEPTCNVGDLGLIPRLGRSPGEGNDYPTPVFWPGEFHGLRSLWGRQELDMAE